MTTHESAARFEPSSEASFVTTRDGVRQRVRRWKPVGSPRASLLIHHGIGEHSGRYERAGRLFADGGLDVTAYDCRGHGQTEGRRGYVERYDRFLDDVEEHLREARNHSNKVILMGHSMGGLVAARYAVSERPQPDLLVLSAPAIDAEVPGWQRTAAPILSKVLPKLSLATPIERGQLTRDTAVEDAYFADPLVFTTATTRLGAEIFVAMEHTRRHVDRIRVPTLVFHGGRDVLVATRFSEPLSRVEGVEREVFPTLLHETLNEPEGPEVIAFVLGWVDRHLEA
jgi:alpha-beta hydrolase superfamily lysophospholipase